jgi:hypothetical protein
VDGRTTGIAAALVVVLAFVVAGALALGAGDDEPRDVASETGLLGLNYVDLLGLRA